jgi:poly-gamma-glutamate synthesis protein (capsule biosynthesis protein)
VEQRDGTVTLIAGADVGTVTEPVERFAEFVLPALRSADLRFAQCERSFSTRGCPPGWGRNGTGEGSGDHTRLDPARARIWSTAGIDVASLASNHTRDWGPDALVDTIDLFHEMGIATIGAGRDDDEARRPAVFERNGVRVAFLAYVSVMRNGEQAGDGRPGLAPLRARTYYEPIDYQPGCPPRILTVPYAEDVQAMERDIQSAKQIADVVVVSLHWGVHFLPKVLATYQPEVAHAAIDAGADLILGHHTHLLSAVEVYRGRACFYGMGNFMSSGSGKGAMERTYYNIYWFPPAEDGSVSTSPFPEDSRKSMLVRAVMSASGVERVSF